jgi:hypothetical protein
MAEDDPGPPRGPEDPPDPHPLAPDPDRAGEPPDTFTLTGLYGKSDAQGKWRLYLSPRLDYYAEFHESAVKHHVQVRADSPVKGYSATRVTLKRGEPITFHATEAVVPQSQFDLDIRMEVAASPAIVPHRTIVTSACTVGCTVSCTPGCSTVGCPTG